MYYKKNSDLFALTLVQLWCIQFALIILKPFQQLGVFRWEIPFVPINIQSIYGPIVNIAWSKNGTKARKSKELFVAAAFYVHSESLY